MASNEIDTNGNDGESGAMPTSGDSKPGLSGSGDTFERGNRPDSEPSRPAERENQDEDRADGDGTATDTHNAHDRDERDQLLGPVDPAYSAREKLQEAIKSTKDVSLTARTQAFPSLRKEDSEAADLEDVLDAGKDFLFAKNPLDRKLAAAKLLKESLAPSRIHSQSGIPADPHERVAWREHVTQHIANELQKEQLRALLDQHPQSPSPESLISPNSLVEIESQRLCLSEKQGPSIRAASHQPANPLHQGDLDQITAGDERVGELRRLLDEAKAWERYDRATSQQQTQEIRQTPSGSENERRLP